jgi:hypothetical protein
VDAPGNVANKYVYHIMLSNELDTMQKLCFIISFWGNKQGNIQGDS